MSNESLRQEVTGWAEYYNIYLTEEQINSLIEGINQTIEIDMYFTGWTPGHKLESEEQKEIARLKNTINNNNYEFNEKERKLIREYNDRIDCLIRTIDNLKRE